MGGFKKLILYYIMRRQHCITVLNGQNVFQSCLLIISRGLNFPEMGRGGGLRFLARWWLRRQHK